MINKKQNLGNNANRKRINGTEEKRYSKSKFKKDNVTLEERREETEKKSVKTIKGKTPEYYQEAYSKMALKRHYDVEGGGKVESVKAAILTKPSLQAHGYSVLPKGQCVIVTKYVGSEYRKVVSQDHRVGIIPNDGGVKALNFSF